jgi:hypothetical protein
MTNLLNVLDNYLMSQEKRERTSHYPSDINACLRQLYYKWTKEPESDPITPGGYLKMGMGSSIHDYLFNQLLKSGLEVISEIEFKKTFPILKYPISGRVDNLFVDSDNNISGIEIKSGYGRGIVAIKENGPKIEHLFQVACYLHFTDIKRFHLLYIARDNAYRTQFVVEKIDDKIYILNEDGSKKEINITVAQMVNKLEQLESCVALRHVPDRGGVVAIKNGEMKDSFQKNMVKFKTSWFCSYCQYKTMCWKEVLPKYQISDNSEMFKGLSEDED